MAPDGTLTEFPLAVGNLMSGTGARQLAAGSNVLWFAQPQGGSLGRTTCG
jgi:hypothetical protein